MTSNVIFTSLISVSVETTRLLSLSHHFRVKRRGISEVTGNVKMLGIVGIIAALVLTLGLGPILDFNTVLINAEIEEDVIKGDIIIEFVEFNVGTLTLDIHVRNVGLTDVTVDSISIINTDTQKFILQQTDVGQVVQSKTKEAITTDNVIDCVIFAAPAVNCTDANYRITISTERGNIYEVGAVPFRA